jgi:hypothetical protein
MSPDPLDHQPGDFLDELPKALVFLDPFPHLLYEILRDVDRLGLSGNLEGQGVADVLGSGLAVTALATAMLGDFDEAGRDDGTMGLQLPNSALDHGLQEALATWSGYAALLGRRRLPLSEKYIHFSGIVKKKACATLSVEDPAGLMELPASPSTTWGYAGQVRRMGCWSGLDDRQRGRQ